MLCNTVKRLVVYNLYNFEKLGSVSRDLKDRETESLQESKPNFPPRTLKNPTQESSSSSNHVFNKKFGTAFFI